VVLEATWPIFYSGNNQVFLALLSYSFAKTTISPGGQALSTASAKGLQVTMCLFCPRGAEVKDDRKLLELRTLVGYLGEKEQFAWWNSSFFSRISDGFLSPVFPKTMHLAKLTGVIAAAARLHEERIGRGRVFHIFRLPEELEFKQHELMRAEDTPADFDQILASPESAMSRLGELAEELPLKEGPIRLGDESVLSSDDWMSQAASIYYAAFSDQKQSFPYWSRLEAGDKSQ